METRVRRHKLHTIIYAIARAIGKPVLKLMFSYKGEKLPEKENNYIVLANHVQAYDPLLLAISLKKHMYIVASEHLMQKGFASKLLKRFIDPIVRQKSGSAVAVVKEMLFCLNKGYNVCIFPEGTCSYSGKNSPMISTIGRVVKTAGKTLITYRFDGGFFIDPRWGLNRRKGKCTGSVAGIYSPEKIKELSADDINEIIINDLYSNAYEWQEREKVEYKSKNIAEALETSFYICPECRKIGGLSTKGNEILCECGMSARLDGCYKLHGMPFKTLIEWDEWQEDKLEEISKMEGFSLSDEGVKLTRITKGHETELLCEGNISLSKDGIKTNYGRLETKDIDDAELIRRNTLVLTSMGTSYQITGDKRFCARKYMQLLRLYIGDSN